MVGCGEGRRGGGVGDGDKMHWCPVSMVQYWNDLQFSDRQIWATSVDPDQTAPEGCLAFCTFWKHFSMVKPHLNFRIHVINTYCFGCLNFLDLYRSDSVQVLVRFYPGSEEGQWESSLRGTFEPPHDKTNKMAVRSAKTQINLGIRPVWSESSLSWVLSYPLSAQRRLIKLGISFQSSCE